MSQDREGSPPRSADRIDQQALDELLRVHPYLCLDGYGVPDNVPRDRRLVWLADSRKLLAQRLERIRQAAAWLEPIPRISHARSGPTSHGLRHLMERDIGLHVTNGEMAAAALLLGVPYHSSPMSLNVHLGISRRAERAIERRLHSRAGTGR